MVIKKKILYYLAAIAIITFTCFMTLFTSYGDKMYSIFKLMVSVSKTELQDNCITLNSVISNALPMDVFNFFIVSLFLLSCVYDELKDNSLHVLKLGKAHKIHIFKEPLFID